MIVSPVPSEFGDVQYESKATPLTCQHDAVLSKQGGYNHVRSISRSALVYMDRTHELCPSPHATTFRSSMLQT